MPPERLGWNAHFEEHFTPFAARGLAAGRVAAEHRGAYVLLAEAGELWARLTGRLRHEAASRAELPAVGDWVVYRLHGEEGTIEAVLPRRTAFSRKVAWVQTEEQILAANVDVVFIVSALTAELKVRRLERYLTMAWESGADPVVVLTKSDLCEDLPGMLAEVEAVTFGLPVHVVSGRTGEGLDELDPYLAEGTTVALLGSSGVGKSTLLNALLGEERQLTRPVREDDGRGRHTTVHRELVRLPGGALVVDTPGLRELQLWEAADGFEETFADIAELAGECKFNDCTHEREPGCAVQAALADGTLAAERYASWRKLQRELRALEVRQSQRLRAEERRRWRTREKEARQRARMR